MLLFILLIFSPFSAMFRYTCKVVRRNGEESSTASISASIVQGSGIGPAAYTVIAADLKPLQPGNSLVEFADDTYLV